MGCVVSSDAWAPFLELWGSDGMLKYAEEDYTSTSRSLSRNKAIENGL